MDNKILICLINKQYYATSINFLIYWLILISNKKNNKYISIVKNSDISIKVKNDHSYNIFHKIIYKIITNNKISDNIKLIMCYKWPLVLNSYVFMMDNLLSLKMGFLDYLIANNDFMQLQYRKILIFLQNVIL
jgi:hypothetical protein